MSIHPIEKRYGSKEMRSIWEKENELRIMLKIEAALAEAGCELGIVPKDAATEIRDKANTSNVSLNRVEEIEDEIHHDIMAVVKALSEQCGDSAGEFVHLGATSNDIKDTTRGIQIRDSLSIIKKELLELEDILIEKCTKYKNLVCCGRTHGQHAIPTTLGHKLAIYANEIRRNHERLLELEDRIVVGQITGAVGTQASLGKIGEEVHQKVMKKVGLKPVTISNQIIQRDRHAELISTLAIISSTLDKIAKEIRNLQRTEIKEVEEPFKEGQVGSSTMPQKRNPIKSERICGISKVIRGNVQTSLENIPLEHERDLTNSSSERMIIPETFLLIDEQLNLICDILKDIVVHEERIQEILNMTDGLNMSESIMMTLVKEGMGRQTAHEVVRKCAMKSYEEDESFLEVLAKNKKIKKLMEEEEIKEALDPNNYLGCAIEHIENVKKIYNESRRE